jgi:uncharacterized protein YidB (DUF937 family)
MDLVSLATDLLVQNVGKNLDSETVVKALGALSGGGESGGFDLGKIVSQISSSGMLGDVLDSWLGDGENKPIDHHTVKNMFDDNQLDGFASSLGMDKDSASSVLANVLPNLIDKSSSGGSLLDSVGGLEGAMDMMKKFF